MQVGTGEGVRRPHGDAGGVRDGLGRDGSALRPRADDLLLPSRGALRVHPVELSGGVRPLSNLPPVSSSPFRLPRCIVRTTGLPFSSGSRRR